MYGRVLISALEDYVSFINAKRGTNEMVDALAHLPFAIFQLNGTFIRSSTESYYYFIFVLFLTPVAHTHTSSTRYRGSHRLT